MVQGEWRSHHGAALIVKAREDKPHLARYVWNGEEISIHFEGFGCVVVYATKNFEVIVFQSHPDGPIFLSPGTFPEYLRSMDIDELEGYVRDVIRQPFTKYGIDPQSYSLNELRLFGMGLVRGWSLERGMVK